jgi:hypothetical protein
VPVAGSDPAVAAIGEGRVSHGMRGRDRSKKEWHEVQSRPTDCLMSPGAAR